MIDPVKIAPGFNAYSAMDDDGELELQLFEGRSVWLSRGQILKLITHLGKVLDDADEGGKEMSLSCFCDCDDDEYYYLPPADYDTAETPLKCSSCKQSIPAGATIATFEVMSHDENGEEQYDEDEYMCETCADLYFSLEELGFCITLGEDMRELAEEYAEMVKHGEFQ